MIIHLNKKAAASAIATGTLLFNAFATTAFASTTLQISGNGSSSTNGTQVNSTNTNTVVQNNDAEIHNNVKSNVNTGNNNANDNTGGDVLVLTGDAASRADLSTKANLNVAHVDNCNCGSDTDVLISGNGSSSRNNAFLNQTNTNSVFQDNRANIHNDVKANVNTGNNDANRNTGGSDGGRVTVLTGNGSSDVAVSNAANANLASVGGNSGSGTGGTSVRILGNGSSSDNHVNLFETRSNTVTQDNDANIRNKVDANVRTGNNDANDNTGGDVTVDTGSARSRVMVDNLANFNAASIDCGCTDDVLAKIAGNGSRSDNNIFARLDDVNQLFQGGRQNGNRARLNNDVDSNARTGDNDANRNTGPVIGDPTNLLTGNSLSETFVSNEANANVFSSGADMHMPADFSFNFDLGGLWSWLH